jgi:hypothetical protein
MSSPRRTGAEVNILAMLDGHTGKPLSKRFPALPRKAWYGAAGVLAVTVLGTIAWLVHSPDAEPGDATVASQPTPILPAAPGPVIQPDPVPEPPPPVLLAQPVPPQGATIVNIDPPQPAEAAAPQPARVELPEASPAARPLAQKATLARGNASPAPKPAAAPARTAANQARHVLPAPAAARKRGPAAAKPGQAPAVDTDVALISAIIQHVNKRGELKENPEPPNKPAHP